MVAVWKGEGMREGTYDKELADDSFKGCREVHFATRRGCGHLVEELRIQGPFFKIDVWVVGDDWERGQIFFNVRIPLDFSPRKSRLGYWLLSLHTSSKSISPSNSNHEAARSRIANETTLVSTSSGRDIVIRKAIAPPIHIRSMHDPRIMVGNTIPVVSTYDLIIWLIGVYKKRRAIKPSVQSRTDV